MKDIEQIELKIGDRLYIKKYGLLSNIETIIKLTPTTVKSKHYTFKVQYGNIRVVGQGKWDTVSAYLETPELKKEWKELYLKMWIAKNWSKIPLDDIEILMNKLSKETKDE